MNEFIYKTVWRSGIVLKSGENLALIKADTEDKKIYIWINGTENTRRDFLSAIRAQFESIHKTITNLDVREKVAVPGYPNIVVDFEHLLTLEQRGMNEFLPEGMKELISVGQLLNGVAHEDDRQKGNVTNIHVGKDFNGNLTVGEKNVSRNDTSPTKSPVPTIELNKSVATDTKSKSLPYIIGRLILDLFTQHEPAETTTNIIGWIIIILLVIGIVIAVLSVLGFIDIASLRELLTGWWQILFPPK